MIKTIDATIFYTYKGKKYTFHDVYKIDTDFYDDNDEILCYIKHDLKLVAGGGYSTENVKNAKFKIIGGGLNIGETRPKNNRIPRQFNRITAKALIELSSGKIGDIYHIFRNYDGLLCLNTSTGKYYNLPAATARNINVFEFIEVI